MGEKQFDLAAFKAFVASKPADEEYDALEASVCAFAQFGLPGLDWNAAKKLRIAEPVYDAAIVYRPYTFGALATRLASLPTTPEQQS